MTSSFLHFSNPAFDVNLLCHHALTVLAELDLNRLARTVLSQAIRLEGADKGTLLLGRPDAVGYIPLVAANVSHDDRQLLPTASDSLRTPQEGRSILWKPLVAPSGDIGALYLEGPNSNGFLQEGLLLLDVLAPIAAIAIERAQAQEALIAETARLRELGPCTIPEDRFVGMSPQIEALRRRAASVAFAKSPLLIVGEPGTGRRLLARCIHDLGRRSREAFVIADGSVPPGSLFKEALLGHVEPDGDRAAGARVGIEAFVAFVGRAKRDSYGLYGAVYEFQWTASLQAIKDAAATGADVHILYEGIQGGSGRVTKNEDAIAAAKIKGLCKPKTTGMIRRTGTGTPEDLTRRTRQRAGRTPHTLMWLTGTTRTTW